MEIAENSYETALAALTPPYVSIIIPVYCVEKTLRACLISAVSQTLPEIEVIAVNDASPDNSQLIVDEFVEKYPGKVRSVIHEQNQGLAYARRTGLEHARAPYVVFLDSDDFISGDLCQNLLEEILVKDLDLLYYPLMRCWEGSDKREIMSPPLTDSQDELIKKGVAAFCGGMYRKEFLLQQKETAFLSMLYEDAATTPSLISKTEKVGVYRKKPFYFYRFGRIGSITTAQMTERKMMDSFKGDYIGFENVLPEFMEAYAFRALKRAANTMNKEGSIYDYSVFHLKEIVERTKEYEQELPEGTQRVIDRAMEYPDEVSIPKIVYINGFVRNELKDFDRYLAEAKKAYLFDPEVVILDESNCDLSLLPEWLKDASNEEKGIYFALSSIGKKGGIYISPAVQVITSFNREAFRGAFFVAGPEVTVIPAVFGGSPDHPLFVALQQAMDREETAWERNSVMDCVMYTLIGECGVHLTGKEEKGLHDVHMLNFGDVCYGLNPEKSYCVLNYNNYVNADDNTSALPQNLMEFAWELAAEKYRDIEESLSKAKNDTKKAQIDMKKKNKELNSIKKNRFFRIAQKLWRLIPKKIRNLLK